jgi:hypothetical protein
MVKSLLGVVVWCGVLLPALVAAEMPCSQVDWDYPTGYPQLGFFRAYVSKTSGSYQFCGDNQDCVPAAMEPSIGELVTALQCSAFVVWSPGTYYLVMTAVSQDLSDESWPSNEISFTIEGPASLPPADDTPTSTPTTTPTTTPTATPTAKPTAVAGVPKDLPLPPPWRLPAPYQPPPGSGAGDAISKTCMWTGTC